MNQLSILDWVKVLLVGLDNLHVAVARRCIAVTSHLIAISRTVCSRDSILDWVKVFWYYVVIVVLVVNSLLGVDNLGVVVIFGVDNLLSVVVIFCVVC